MQLKFPQTSRSTAERAAAGRGRPGAWPAIWIYRAACWFTSARVATTDLHLQNQISNNEIFDRMTARGIAE